MESSSGGPIMRADRDTDEKIISKITSDIYDFIALLNINDRTITFRTVNEKLIDTVPHITDDYDRNTAYALYHLLEKDEAQQAARCMSIARVISELEDHDSYIYSFTFTDKNGNMRKKQHEYLYLDKDEGLILFTRMDVTELFITQERQLESMRESLKAAEEAYKAKDEFLSRVSHDIRTPLNVINSMTDFAVKDFDDEEKLRDDLSKIKIANTFLLSLINDILDLSRIDSGKIQLNYAPYSYEEFSSNIKGMFGPLCDAKNICFTITDPENRDTLMTDSVRMNQIILNLLSNSVKFTPENGKIDFIVTCDKAGDDRCDITFTVKDTGCGMSKEFQKRMFEPFTQDSGNAKAELQGTGLGLSIVRKLVDLMGGYIEVESALGEGTKITVGMSLKKAPDDYVKNNNEYDKSITAAHSGCLVLVAEDNDLNAQITTRLLEEQGYKTVVAKNGQAALCMFTGSDPGTFGLILMDVNMPVMDGLEATEKIRRSAHPQAKDIPIIAMTADSYTENIKKCLDCGMNAHISKPVDVRKMFETINRILG